MKVLQLKILIIALLGIFATNILSAQAILLVEDRIDAEIAKQNATNLSSKTDQSKIASFKSQQKVAIQKATPLEGFILGALKGGKKNSSAKIGNDTYTFDLVSQVGLAEGGPKIPPGPKPCAPGNPKCFPGFLLATNSTPSDLSTLIAKISINQKSTLNLYFVPVNGDAQVNTAKHRVSFINGLLNYSVR